MNTASIVFGILAVVGLALGIIPFLGWTNWFITLPLGLVGLVLGAIAGEGQRSGLILCGVVLLLAGMRLLMGGGLL